MRVGRPCATLGDLGHIEILARTRRAQAIFPDQLPGRRIQAVEIDERDVGLRMNGNHDVAQLMVDLELVRLDGLGRIRGRNNQSRSESREQEKCAFHGASLFFTRPCGSRECRKFLQCRFVQPVIDDGHVALSDDRVPCVRLHGIAIIAVRVHATPHDGCTHVAAILSAHVVAENALVVADHVVEREHWKRLLRTETVIGKRGLLRHSRRMKHEVAHRIDQRRLCRLRKGRADRKARQERKHRQRYDD
ncbi:hypothetical protein BDW16_0004 [Sphingomonas koreensis]|nr:hypothetical protein BDW16_0004 [Sphingomonas koreensis]